MTSAASARQPILHVLEVSSLAEVSELEGNCHSGRKPDDVGSTPYGAHRQLSTQVVTRPSTSDAIDCQVTGNEVPRYARTRKITAQKSDLGNTNTPIPMLSMKLPFLPLLRPHLFFNFLIFVSRASSGLLGFLEFCLLWVFSVAPLLSPCIPAPLST